MSEFEKIYTVWICGGYFFFIDFSEDDWIYFVQK